jgi:hypothetical protein
VNSLGADRCGSEQFRRVGGIGRRKIIVIPAFFSGFFLAYFGRAAAVSCAQAWRQNLPSICAADARTQLAVPTSVFFTDAT